MGHLLASSAMDSVVSLLQIDYENPSYQLSHSEIMVGFSTKHILLCIQDDAEPRKRDTFYEGVKVSSHELQNI